MASFDATFKCRLAFIQEGMSMTAHLKLKESQSLMRESVPAVIQLLPSSVGSTAVMAPS